MARGVIPLEDGIIYWLLVIVIENIVSTRTTNLLHVCIFIGEGHIMFSNPGVLNI